MTALEAVAVALAYGGADMTEMGDVIPQDVWESLFERGLLQQQRPLHGEPYTGVTPEAEAMLQAHIASIASSEEQASG